MNKLAKSFVALGVVAGAAIGGLWVAQPASAAISAGCSNFNVVECGTKDVQTLRSTYTKRTEIRQLYSQFGITEQMINGANMQEGTVDANGNVTVGGRVVATGARTLQAKAGTKQKQPEGQRTAGGHTYYQYPTGDSFILGKTTFSVYAWFDNNGKFIAGVIKDCGNPIWGTPTPPPAKPSLTCDALQATQVSRNEYQFTAKATAKEGAKVVNYIYDFGDGKTTNGGATVRHTYAKEGTYTVKMTVVGSEGGSTNVEKTSKDCQVTIKVTPQPTIQVCELSSSTIITIKESEFDATKHSKNVKDCDKMKVCELKTGAIVTIKEKEFDEKKHSKNVADCDKVKVCRISDKKIVEVRRNEVSNDYTTDMSKCEQTPPTPVAELPHTGLGGTLLPLAGIGSLTAAGAAYYVSRHRK
jgi:PKD domain containing protein